MAEEFLRLFMSGPFGGFSIPKKKAVISDVALCVECMRVLHSNFHVIHGDFQLIQISYSIKHI